MIQKVLLISGRQQSGKSSLRNYIVGRKLVEHNIVDTFNISTRGELMIPVEGKDCLQCIDLNQRNPQFLQFGIEVMWPLVKNYSIANEFKYYVMDMFDLEYEHCFGTDEEKNKPTNIRWSDISFCLPPRTIGSLKDNHQFNEFMTGREFLQNFGKFCRTIRKNCFVESMKKKIIREGYPFAVIDDIRFPDELEVLDDGTFETASVRLLRNPIKSKDESETAFDGLNKLFDLLVSSKATIEDKQNTVATFLEKKQWLV